VANRLEDSVNSGRQQQQVDVYSMEDDDFGADDKQVSFLTLLYFYFLLVLGYLYIDCLFRHCKTNLEI